MPQTTDSIPLEQPGLFLFVGPADAGKSFASTSFGLKSKKYGGDDPRSAYMLELDGRIAALRNRPVVFDAFTNEEGAIGVLNKLEDLCEVCTKRGMCPFHTVIVASFTSFNDMAIGESLSITDDYNDEHEKDKKGRRRGELSLMTTEDYGYEAEAVRKLLWERLNIIKKYAITIVEAHETEYYRPVKTKPGEPTRTELAGYKILARDKISAKLPTKFDEIYHFLPKEVVLSMQQIRRTVVFQDIVARSSYPQIQALGTAKQDITGKEFYPFWREIISRET